jgi:hypothetical protein
MYPLLPIHEVFISEYLVCMNATEAARRAGVAPKNANQQGWRWLNDPDIRAAINERLEERAMPSNELLQRLTFMARASLKELFHRDENGKLRLDLDFAYETGMLDWVKEYRESPRGGVHIVMYDPFKALEALAKYYTLFSPTDDFRAILTMMGVNPDEFIRRLAEHIKTTPSEDPPTSPD